MSHGIHTFRHLLISFAVFILLAVLSAALQPSIGAQPVAEEKTVFSFDGSEGTTDFSGLIRDSAGNVYGTAAGGGQYGFGTVYEVAPSGGSLAGKVLYNFTGGADGATPEASLIADSSGNLYGTTYLGGNITSQYCNPRGCGVVFELSPSNGSWTETVLYAFTGVNGDGVFPVGALIFDHSGNLYGTDSFGGSGSGGIVFELSRSNGSWNETILYSFSDIGSDGISPQSAVAFDRSGNLYGTTVAGGTGGCMILGSGCGTIYELSLSHGSITEKILYSFTGQNGDGSEPYTPVVLDSSGNLYGATVEGGDLSCLSGFGCGIVFELSPSNGSWSETILHAFTGSADGGYSPSSVILDSSGNVYGTTSTGGDITNGACNTLGCGVVFKLSPVGGSWQEAVLHTFTGMNGDGANPSAGLTVYGGGIYVSTFVIGGANGDGGVFGVRP
jgi:uncharacterized repeat protein (TIGR03803 family)